MTADRFRMKMEDLKERSERISKEKWAKGGLMTGTEDDYREEVTVELNTVFEKDLFDVMMDLFQLLTEKNRKYGDAALNPDRIFSKANAEEQLLVRIDDKLSRIKNQQNDEDEDVVQDLIGYLILLTIVRERIA